MIFRDSWTVAKKDLSAFLKDKVILMQILLLPFAIVFGYAMLMSTMADSAQPSESNDAKAYYVNAPADFEAPLISLGYKKAEKSRIDKIKEEIKNKDSDLLIVFPKGFTLKESGAALDNVDIWYNSETNSSLSQFNAAVAMLNEFQPKAFSVNAVQSEKYDMGDENFALKKMMGMILPIMVLMSVFMVCMNLAANSIAGEKEHGFMNTLLVTPIKRGSIAFGKSLCIFIASLIGGLSAFTGMAVSLPQLAKTFGAENSFSFSFGEYFLLFAVTVTAVFVLVGILLIISTVAKDVKQATTIAPIFIMLLMVAGMLTMSDNIRKAVESIGMANYLIPSWNSMRIIQEIIEMKYDLAGAGITCLVNLAVAVLTVWIVSRLFNRESMLAE